jgi:hypothetical protein
MGSPIDERPLYQKTPLKQDAARGERAPNHKKYIAASLLMGIGYNLEKTLPTKEIESWDELEE